MVTDSSYPSIHDGGVHDVIVSFFFEAELIDRSLGETIPGLPELLYSVIGDEPYPVWMYPLAFHHTPSPATTFTRPLLI
jgi:hypothetical protein